MKSENDALAMLGISAEEAIEADQSLTRRPSRDRRICLCGHAVNKHDVSSGLVQCIPSAYRCPCKNIEPVLQVEDTRLFLRKTNGPGLEHALVRGMAASSQQGKEVKWIETPACKACGKTSSESRITPTSVTEFGQVSYSATGFDALLCEDCLEKAR